MRIQDENGVDKVAAMKQTYSRLKLDCLVILGGNGTTANLLSEEGLNVVTLPKTIDNDIWGTVMGHKVGWLTLHAGIAGGADIILVPEIPYDLKKVVEVLDKRMQAGKRFTILAVAEGAISKEDVKLSKKEYKEKRKRSKYPSISYELAAKIEAETGQEIRITVPGHTQRGGEPCPYDRVLSTRLGAADLILNKQYGYMVGIRNGEIEKAALQEVAGRLKKIQPDSSIIKEIKSMGISFGD